MSHLDASAEPLRVNRRVMVRGLATAAGALVAGNVLAACGATPGGSKTTTGAAAGAAGIATSPVTIRHWDYVDSPAWKPLVSGFQRRHPNVSVKHVLKTGDELNTQAKFNLSGGKPVDLLQNDGGYVAMPLVKAQLWEDLTPYAERYDWASRYPASFLRDCRYSTDGSRWGTADGGLYNLPFYISCTPTHINRRQLAQVGVTEVPASIDELESAMEKLKAQDILPICIGAQAGIGPTLLAQALINHYADAKELRDFFYGVGGTFTSKPVVQALERLRSWKEKGYIADNFIGIAEVDMATRFVQGKGAIMVVQSSFPTLEKVASQTTITSFPPLKPGGPARLTGNPGGPGIGSRSKGLPTAAGWLDYITAPEQTGAWLDAGMIPAAKPPAGTSRSGLVGQALKMLDGVRADDGFVTYLAGCSPTAVKTFGGALQDMLSGRATAEQVAQRVQRDRDAYLKTL